MLIVEERALITDLQDKIIELLVEQQEASADGNTSLVAKLQRDVDRMRAECTDIRQHAEKHVPRRTA